MEIRNDLSSRMVTQSAMGSAHIGEGQQVKNSQPAGASSGISPDRRNLIDAMTLMQTASGIVQEALNVSSKLRMLAMTSMMSGQTNQNEISETMAGIRSSLQQYGHPVSTPPVQDGGERVTYGMPDIGGELDSLGSMIKKNQFGEKEMNPVISSLEEKGRGVESSVEQLGKRAGAEKFTYGQRPAPATDIAGMITGNHAQALNAQGNIRSEAVSSLIR
jgi:hypothetical protein